MELQGFACFQQATPQARQQHPSSHIDPAVVEGNVRGVQAGQHQGGRPPGPLEHRPTDHAASGCTDQQPQHETHHQGGHGHTVAERQIDRQVVGMAVPVARAAWVDEAEGGRSPAQPGAFGDQADRHLPLRQAGDRQGPLAGELQVAEAAPDRLRNERPGRGLEQSGDSAQAGEADQAHRQQQQRQKPGPGGRPHHERQRHHQRTPGVAGIGEEQRRRQGGGDQQGDPAQRRSQRLLHQGCQGERPGQGQPRAGDVGVVEQS